MEQLCTFHYETEANASYLVAVLPQNETFISYQMKMLENNQILHLLEARKYQQDESIHICYNVTSRMSLEQVLTRQRMRKEEFLALLKGLAEAYRELPEYQLSHRGLVLDEAQIFVRSGSFEPSFVYLPVYEEDGGLEGLREFVRKMILESRIANTGDNFIQQILELVNDPALTLERLLEEVSAMGRPSAAQQPAPQPVLQPAVQDIPVPREPEAPKPPAFANKPLEQADRIPGAVRESESVPGKARKKDAKAEKKPRPTKEKSSKASTVFLAVQGVVVIALALAVKTGFFLTDGALNISYIAGFLIAVGGLDVVLYRELFLNRKSGHGSGEKKQAGKKPGKGGKQERCAAGVKGRKIPREEGKAAVRAQETAAQQAPAMQQPYQPASAPVYYQPAPAMQYGVSPERPVSQEAYAGGAEDRTVVIEEEFSDGYLEYFENGLVMRIHLNEGVTRVGSRAQSVDHVLASHKVSKVHAEFIRQGERYFVRDINSTNGTFLNGSRQRIVSNQDIELHPGDQVRLADIDLTFKC